MAEAAGFRYRFDPASGLFAHASGFIVIRPDGIVSRYFLGVDFRPAEIATALADAAAGRTGRKMFDLLLACLGGVDSAAHSSWPWRVLQAGAAGTILALVIGLTLLLRHERRRSLNSPPP